MARDRDAVRPHWIIDMPRLYVTDATRQRMREIVQNGGYEMDASDGQSALRRRPAPPAAPHGDGGTATMRKILALALNTAREAVRNRILYSILFFAVLMVAVAAVFGAASIGDQTKYMKDFSLMSVSLFGVIIAIVLGVNLLHQELGRKTIFNILSKPVARWQFIVGKFFGLLATLSLIVILMSGGVVACFVLLTGRLDGGW